MCAPKVNSGAWNHTRKTGVPGAGTGDIDILSPEAKAAVATLLTYEAKKLCGVLTVKSD